MSQSRSKKGFILLLSLGLLAIVTLTIIVGGAFVYKIDQEMMLKFQQKKLIQPTIFYSRAETWSREKILPFADLEIRLKKQFRWREPDQRLFEGDFTKAAGESCRPLIETASKQLEGELRENDLCLRIFWPQGPHPKFKTPWIETVWVDSDFHIKGVYQGESLNSIENFTFTPQVIAQYLGGDPILREEISLSQIPVTCLNAIIAIEDVQFLEHKGISPVGILRAVAVNLLKGRKAQGGSTLTQQLIKNYFLTPEKTLKRKALEFIMALLIEARLDKDLILETYLNVIYMGQQGPYQVRGYGAAAHYYFQKPLSDLNLEQCSLLAAIVNSPGQYNPFTHPEKARERRGLVLQKMLEQQMITAHEKVGASSGPLPVNENPNLYLTLPYFLQGAVEQAQDLQFEDLTGYRVFTTMDLRLQEQAQTSIEKNLQKIESENKTILKIKSTKKINLESALVSVDISNGEVRSLVGGRSYRQTQFNRILSARRQVGSTFKPLVYLTALQSDDEGITPLMPLEDKPFTHKYGSQKWSPENYDHSYYGKVPMYFALKESLNLATANLALSIGLDSVIETARALGVKSPLQPVPSLSLGAFELKPIELLQAYLTIARFGNFIEPTFIEYLINEEGQEQWAANSRKGESKVSSTASQILIGLLKQTARSGTAQKISQSGFNKTVAGKTGTTNGYRDSWFVGFTPELLTLVWTGYDNNTSSGLTGASGAIPAWLSYMQEATKFDQPRDFPWTNEVIMKTISTIELKNNGFWENKDAHDPETIDLMFKNETKAE